jgi:phosphatidate cytidylyltransferase
MLPAGRASRRLPSVLTGGDLVPRVLSGVVLIGLAGACVYVGGIPLDLLVGAAAGLCAWELCDLLAALPVPAPRWLVIPFTVWLAERAVLPGAGGSTEVILSAALLAGVVAGVALRVPWSGWAAGLGGGLYLGVGLGSLLGVDHWAGVTPGVGRGLLALVAGAVIATDTVAYFAGRAVGRHRHPFFPAISPKKSLEGAIGGALGAIVVAGIAGPLALGLNPGAAIGIGLAIAVAAEAGDLAESALKRQAAVKDSGHLIPGHGGLMDRVDGLILAAPAAYALLLLIDFR